MKRQAARICLSGLLLLCFLNAVSSQKPAAVDTWLGRAEALTADLTYDAARLDRYDRALMWARLGDIWWSSDPNRARAWFLNAVDLVEFSAEDDKSSRSCRLTAARTVLSIVATRDKGLHERLMSMMGAEKENLDDSQRAENATALADAALSLVASDPQSAKKLGAASLRLGFSLHIAQLLWKLHKVDPASANELFGQAIQGASATGDFNIFSMLTTAAFQGPFSSDSERRLVLSAFAEILQRPRPSPSDGATICKLAVFVPPLLNYFDTLLPGESQRVRAALGQCQSRPTSEVADSSDESGSGRRTPETVEDLLKAAVDPANRADQDYYLLKAVHRAADLKDFDRAISILDSIDDENRKRIRDSWDSLRWDYAGQSACVRLESNDRPAMIKVIEATPSNLRAFVNLSLASTCKAARDRVQIMEFVEAGRKQLEKAATAEQPAWYFGLVGFYARLSPADAPAVLSEAIAAINRASEGKTETCESGEGVSAVLTTQLLLKRYTLPASVLEPDDVGVRSAVGSIRPADRRAAVRLQLLIGALDQHRLTAQRATQSKTTK